MTYSNLLKTYTFSLTINVGFKQAALLLGINGTEAPIPHTFSPGAPPGGKLYIYIYIYITNEDNLISHVQHTTDLTYVP
jgi:hypothetical protein